MFPERARVQERVVESAGETLRAWWASLVDPGSWGLSSFALVAANAVPLFGVSFLGWQVFTLMLLYWLENVVVGAFNVLRLLIADPAHAKSWAKKLYIIPIFCLHYGFFCFGHGVVVFALFSDTKPGQTFSLISLVLAAVARTRIEFALGAIILSHGISFVANYIRGGEYRRASLVQLMQQPYARIVVLHVAILGGGLAMAVLGSPSFGLVILVAVKTAMDVVAHHAERRKLAGPKAAPGR